jgi:hypothetical protein
MYTSLNLGIELGRLTKRPVAGGAEYGRDRDRVQMQAHAEDQRRNHEPVQNRKPPLGASKQDRPRERLMDQRSSTSNQALVRDPDQNSSWKCREPLTRHEGRWIRPSRPFADPEKLLEGCCCTPDDFS